MNKSTVLIFIAILIIVGAAFLASSPSVPVPAPDTNTDVEQNINPIDNPVVCTQDVKQCPDGSYIGRGGPNCEFAPCPSPNPVPSEKNGVTGVVTLSPTCPGPEPVPYDPDCAPRFYSTTIDVLVSGTTQVVKTTKSDSKGIFSVDLNPGTYVLKAQGGDILPMCPGVSVEVKSGQYVSVAIGCDTGMR